jgi:hypothetical protein
MEVNRWCSLYLWRWIGDVLCICDFWSRNHGCGIASWWPDLTVKNNMFSFWNQQECTALHCFLHERNQNCLVWNHSWLVTDWLVTVDFSNWASPWLFTSPPRPILCHDFSNRVGPWLFQALLVLFFAMASCRRRVLLLSPPPCPS